MEDFPLELYGVLGSKLELRDVVFLASVNSKFRAIFVNPIVNNQLANHFVFPYFINVINLEKYEEVGKYGKLFLACTRGDERLVKGLLESYVFEFGGIILSLFKAINWNHIGSVKVILGALATISQREELQKILQRPSVTDNILKAILKVISFAARNGKTEIVMLILSFTTLICNKSITELLDKEDNNEAISIMHNSIKYYDVAMENAAYGGHNNIVKLMIHHGSKNYNGSLYLSSLGGNVEIVKWMIELGAKNYKEAMYSAAFGGHIEIVKLLVSKIREEGQINVSIYNSSMKSAALGGHIEIVLLMLALGANNFRETIVAASSGGNVQIFILMRDIILFRQLSYIIECDMCMENASEKGHILIVKLSLSLGARDYNKSMIAASSGGHIEIVKLMIALGATDYNNSMIAASKKKHTEIIKLMIKFGGNDYNTVMLNAIKTFNREILKLMLEKGANNYDEAVRLASHRGIPSFVKLIKAYQ